jgi:hypothetical protein
MELRDRFAVAFGQALASSGLLLAAGDLARRAYDLADAMLAERARRMDADERAALDADDPPPPSLHLLDDDLSVPDDDAREDALAAYLEARAREETHGSAGDDASEDAARRPASRAASAPGLAWTRAKTGAEKTG